MILNSVSKFDNVAVASLDHSLSDPLQGLFKPHVNGSHTGQMVNTLSGLILSCYLC